MTDKSTEKPQEERNEDVEVGSIKEDEIKIEAASVDSKDLQNLDLDGAARFLYEHQHLDISDVNITKLRHKIDRNVVSIMSLCFIMQFLDKAIYNVSSCHGSPC
jgi:hypothetical protein